MDCPHCDHYYRNKDMVVTISNEVARIKGYLYDSEKTYVTVCPNCEKTFEIENIPIEEAWRPVVEDRRK